MNICILSRSTIFHPTYGGMEHVANDLAKELARKGHRITFITTALEINQKESIIREENGYNIVYLKETKPMKYSKSWWDSSNQFFESLIKQEDIDIVLSISSAANSIMNIANSKKIPVVFQAHGTALGELRTKWKMGYKQKLLILRDILPVIKDAINIPKYEAVITIGNKVYEEYSTSKIKFNKNILLISNAVDDFVFKRDYKVRETTRLELDIIEDQKVFISTSRLNQQKGIKESIEIFNKVLSFFPKSLFLIIGDGPEEENIKRMINRLGIQKNVKMLGAINREEISKYYNAADFMLFPTLRVEGLPLTILEALSSELICFVSKKIKFNEEYPIKTIDPENIEMSTNTVVDTLKDSEEINNEVRKSGRRVIENNHSLGHWTEMYISEFKKIINNQRKLS